MFEAALHSKSPVLSELSTQVEYFFSTKQLQSSNSIPEKQILNFSTSFFHKCSSSCGSGMQIRSVECVDNHGAHNTQCEPSSRPLSVQSCSTGISCTTEMSTTEFDGIYTSENPIEAKLDEGFDENDDVTEEENDGQQKTSKAAAKATFDDVDDETEEDEDELTMQGDDPRERSRRIPLAYQYRIPRAERLVDPNAPNEPT